MGKSSWWAYLPGTIAIVSMIAVTAYRRPWPARAPVHFDLHWTPDRWGSPIICACFVILAAMILIAQIITTIVWAKHEEGRKRFNPTLALMAAPLGAICGIHLWYWTNLRQLAATGRADHAWAWLFACALSLAAATTVVEWRRISS